MGGPMTTVGGEVTRNGVIVWLGVLLVSSTMGQPQSDPLRLSKRSSMDLRLSKRASTDDLLELYNLSESPELEKDEDMLYESPSLEKGTTCCVSPRETFFACPSATFFVSQRGICFVSLRGICFDCQSEQKRTQTEICV